jgi:HEAT repeat protein
LLPLVSAADAHVRQGAAWALGQLEDAAATDALISATRDDNKHIRTDATWALGLAGNRTAGVSRLIELTRDGEEHVRLAAVCSLAHVPSTGERRIRDAVGALRTDTVAVVREAALWALGRIA